MFILHSSDVFSRLIKAKHNNVATYTEKGHRKRQKCFIAVSYYYLTSVTCLETKH